MDTIFEEMLKIQVTWDFLGAFRVQVISNLYLYFWNIYFERTKVLSLIWYSLEIFLIPKNLDWSRLQIVF